MNSHKGMVVFLCLTVACVWIAVLVLAVPEKEQNVVRAHPQMSQKTYSGKRIDREKADIQAEKSAEDSTSDDSYSNSAINALPSEDTVSVDVILDALEENDFKQ